MGFFQDCFGDALISGGTIQVWMKTITYRSGLKSEDVSRRPIRITKSVQPLTPDEANLLGLGDFSTNEFIKIFSLQEIPMPKGKGQVIMIRHNGIDWYVRKVLPFVWDKGTPMEIGYYKTILSRYSEQVNPN